MLSTNNRLIQREWLLDLIVLAAALTFFYFLWLGSYPLFTPDEGRYSEAAREMIATGDYITPRVNGVVFLDKPILYYWLQAAAMKLLGVNEWAVRFFPALIGIFGCLITYFCGRLLFDRRTGLISAIILATTPLYFANAHYADLNLEVAVLTSSALLFFITGITRQDRWRSFFIISAYIFSALAFLTKGLIGLAFPCIITGCWIMLLSRWKILKEAHLISGLMLFLLLVLPWYILVQKANPAFFHYFFVMQQVTRFLSAGDFNNPTPFWFYLPILLLGIAPWTSFLFQTFYFHLKNIFKSAQEHAKELYLLLWFSIVFVFFSIPHTKTIGYILPTLPPLALLMGRYLSTFWEKSSNHAIYFASLNFIILSLFLSIIFLLLPRLGWEKLPPDFTPYLFSSASIFALSACIALFLIKKRNALMLFSITTICAVLFLLSFTLGTKHLNTNSTKPLVEYLQTIIHPDDEVVNYFRFYQDMPLYLKHRITITTNWEAPSIINKDNWEREFLFGMSFQNTNDWLIDEDTFWKRWKSHKRLFVFTSANYLKPFRTQKTPYFVLGEYNNIVLLSNKL